MPAIVLDRKITLQSKMTTNDEYGQPIETWADEASPWAARRDAGASERFRANQELATQTSVFTIRWRRLTAGNHRISHDGLVWDIEGLAEPPNTRRQWLEITASASGV